MSGVYEWLSEQVSRQISRLCVIKGGDRYSMFVQQLRKHPIDTAIIRVYYSGRRFKKYTLETERTGFLYPTCKLTGVLASSLCAGKRKTRGHE